MAIARSSDTSSEEWERRKFEISSSRFEVRARGERLKKAKARRMNEARSKLCARISKDAGSSGIRELRRGLYIYAVIEDERSMIEERHVLETPETVCLRIGKAKAKGCGHETDN